MITKQQILDKLDKEFKENTARHAKPHWRCI